MATKTKQAVNSNGLSVTVPKAEYKPGLFTDYAPASMAIIRHSKKNPDWHCLTRTNQTGDDAIISVWEDLRPLALLQKENPGTVIFRSISDPTKVAKEGEQAEINPDILIGKAEDKFYIQ